MTETETTLRYVNLTVDLAEACADLERRCFPTADPDELLSAADIAAYARTFPEGFFVCMEADLVVGQGAGILLDFDLDDYQHTIVGITGEHQCGNHDPDGDWYYGTDIAVDPIYRRRGIGQRLYDLRKDLVRRMGKRGIIAGGHLHGFEHHKHTMSADAYIEAVRVGGLYDPTLSFQMHNGFELVGALEGYLADEATDGWSALIVWRNPDLA
ncbi:MAG: GNAT family N-acetyltransferase [Acidimicrobiia bacterium]|nr:GNAT family N-acetyltransferase [Acidimicrobiia bacterium]